MTDSSSIKSFSSFSKGLYPVTEVIFEDKIVDLKLKLPKSFYQKLENRFNKFKCSVLSVDGIYAEVSFQKDKSQSEEYFEITARVARNLFSISTLSKTVPGNKVSLGMLSSNPKKWLLDGLPIGIVTLDHFEIAKGHTYTQEFRFECTEEIFERIKTLQYIGLNASGLFLHNPQSLNGHYYFSIHVGKNTREKSLLGEENLAKGTEFTITLPFLNKL